MTYQTWQSPLGRLHLAASDDGLLALAFDANWPRIRDGLGPLTRGEHPLITQAIAELGEYFRGERRKFSVPLTVRGTAFQRQAWAALRKIPYGRTATYGEQAARIRRPKAVRAVGRANGLNRVSILIPCHRVVGASGALTGYAGGLSAKRRLLALETTHARR